jgi:beta-N-acetylhexosaminidase
MNRPVFNKPLSLVVIMLSLVILLSFADSRHLNILRVPPAPAENGDDGEEKARHASFALRDFYAENGALDDEVERILTLLDERERISQMVMVACGGRGKGFREVEGLLGERLAGSVLFIGQPREDVLVYGDALRNLQTPLLPLFAADGEPSLIHRTIGGMDRFPDAVDIADDDACRDIADAITLNLQELGIHMNFAPVCDFDLTSPAIGRRAFGRDENRVGLMSEAFVSATQARDVAATAKHFPGHGAADGDTHRVLAVVRGTPPEIPVFVRMVDAGVVSVMVGHMEVAGRGLYDSHGRPASLSKTIVTDLLRGELGFRGIVVTDALNMRAVDGSSFPSLDAVEAGCDLILWPRNEERFMNAMLRRISEDTAFREQVFASVRRIVRLKICLGLMNTLDKPATVDDI